MKKYTFIVSTLIISLFAISNAKAQVTVGSGGSPVQGALLQLKENENLEKNSSKGLILPRVYLTNKNNLFPMFAAPGNPNSPNADYANSTYKAAQDKLHVGLIVYNINPNAPFQEGLFVWNGEEWVSLPKNI